MRSSNPSQRPRHAPSTDAWTSLLLVLCAGLVVVAAITAQSPPRAVAATAASSQFSAARAFARLPEVAGEPHPIGTPANARVRDALLRSLRELGLEAHVQRAPAVGRHFGGTGIVENVLGRLPGSVGERAILLVAHYDSVPGAPGAADNGAAVVAVLEALRALQDGPTLANDVMVLFSDGEEVGLLGAEAFVAEHPWLSEVGLVLNFEARGSSGPSVLVETSGANGPLVRALARALRYPNVSSLASAVYELLPNDTDFSVFRARGIPGFNVAFIRDAAHYHTPRDALDTLDLDSLQHHGEHMLALTRHFGDADLRALEQARDERVYVDILRRWVLHYPTQLALPLAAVTLVAWLLLVAAARRRGRVRLREVALGTLALTLALALSAGVGSGLFALLGRLRPDAATRWLAAPYHAETLMLGFVLAALATTLLVALLARLLVRPAALALGGALMLVALAFAAAAWLPGGSYLPTLPALGLLAGLTPVLLDRAEPGSAPWHAWVSLLGAVPGLLLVPPFLAEGFIGLGLALAAPALMLATLGTWLLTPLLDALLAPRAALLPGVLLVASALTLAVGADRAGFGPDQPRPSNAFYVLDPGSELAYFASLQDEPDAWTEVFVDAAPVEVEALHALLPGAPTQRQGAAPVIDLPPPLLDVLSDELEEGTRTLTLRLVAAREASQLTLLLATPGGVRGVELEGRAVPSLSALGPWQALSVYGPMRDGIVVRLRLNPGAPLEAVLVDRSNDLLDLPGLGLPPRPPHLMAAPTPWSDAVLVRRQWRLD